MAFTTLDDDLKIIAKLDDEPNDVGGLTAEELKSKFDEAAGILQNFINQTMLPELEHNDGAGKLGAWLNGEASNVQDALDYLAGAAAKSGNLPSGGHAGDLLVKRSDEVYDSEWREMFTTIYFTEESWSSVSGEYVMTIYQTDHKCTAELNCQIRQLVDGNLIANTWAVMGTESYMDESLNAVFKSTEPYSGTITFFG